MGKPDPIETVLALDQLVVADALIDAELKAAKKAKAKPAALLAILRKRAILAEEGSIDDDLPSLAWAHKRMGEAAAAPGATAEDQARWAWGLLMANATGRARKAGADDAMLKAGIAYAGKPSEERRVALFAASKKQLERAVRLVVQRSEPAAVEARALYEARKAKAPLPDRHTLRALRLAVAALHVVRDPSAEKLSRLDPVYGLSPKDRLVLRKEGLAKMEAMFGSDSELLFQPWYSLSSAAKDAGEVMLSIEARLRVDALLAKRRGEEARVDRSALLIGVRRDLIGLGRIDEAAAIVTREEEVNGLRDLHVPYYTAHAEICEARGDWDGCLENWRLAVVQARESKHWAYGPDSSNLRLTEGWLKHAQERAARARKKR